MPKSRILFVVAIFSLLTTAVFSSAENSAQVRKEYGGKENTPDHLMFDVLLRAMKLRYDADEEFALDVVHENMKLGTRELAEEFLQRMLAAGDDMKGTKRNLDVAVLCQNIQARSKANIYKALNNLDDARIAFSKFAYIEFKKTLKQDEKKHFEAWIDSAKEGYSYTALDHSSLFENSGIDVKTHVQQLCIRFAQEEEELARAQQ